MSFAFSKEEEEEEENEEEEEDGEFVKIMFTCISYISCDIFVHVLHAVTFSHVPHLNISWIENESENWNFLMYGIMLDNPLPSLYYTQH